MSGRAISYPAPCLKAVECATADRHEDFDRGTLWTDREVAWLIANWDKKPDWYCAEVLRRSIKSVRAKAYRLGLTNEQPEEVARDSFAEFNPVRYGKANSLRRSEEHTGARLHADDGSLRHRPGAARKGTVGAHGCASINARSLEEQT